MGGLLWKCLFGRLRRIWKDNIKPDLEERSGTDDCVQWRALIVVMNLWVLVQERKYSSN
jgi:hypothetical protein